MIKPTFFVVFRKKNNAFPWDNFDNYQQHNKFELIKELP